MWKQCVYSGCIYNCNDKFQFDRNYIYFGQLTHEIWIFVEYLKSVKILIQANKFRVQKQLTFLLKKWGQIEGGINQGAIISIH